MSVLARRRENIFGGPLSARVGSTFSDVRHYLPYVVMLAIGLGGVWFILNLGAHLPAAQGVAPTVTQVKETGGSVGSVFWQQLRHPVTVLLTQIIVIIVVSNLFSRLFRSIRQPPVMGEMLAGIVLGPSLLGLLFPSVMNFIFPASSMEPLRLLSQLGVVVFMFVVGMELNVAHLREKSSTAVMISHASIVAPFLLGTTLSLFMYQRLAPAGTSFTAFALFIGVAMSITAFPVLARILEDRKLSKTYLGSIAITCAAVDDATAWCILALVIALVKSTGIAVSLLTVALTVLFVLFMLLVVKPLLNRTIKESHDFRTNSRQVVAGILVVVLASALITEVVGVHALFGAFVAGVIMPTTGEFRVFLKEKLETFSSAALLPLFFAFTGLRTQIGLLNDLESWMWCLIIILVAIIGKLVGSMLMARWNGMSWTNAFSIGVLMNTRGLVELVVLNIGYDLGILSGRIFAAMVLMALVTTFMTGPLLSLVQNRFTGTGLQDSPRFS
jgi:Kef-type K+ transport system membrane component KefB